MNLARPLHHRDGSFAGVIVAAPRIKAIGKFHRMADIGRHGVIAMVGLDDGRLRFALGANAMDPGTSIADSDMFKTMRADPDSTWVGRTALDGIVRVHGFHRVADRDLAVVVAADRDEAMRATEARVFTAYLFASGITALLLLLAAMAVSAIDAARRRETALNRERSILASANTGLALAKASADEKAMHLEATLAGMTDGVAMVDANMLLVEWNPHFPEWSACPVPCCASACRCRTSPGTGGGRRVRRRRCRGRGDTADRRPALRNYADVIERALPDGRVVELRRNRLPDGGFVTLYTDITGDARSMSALREANALAEAATRSMSRFVAIVSHEIRTPLNALLNSLSLLADSGMAATQQALLDMARQSGDALLALINDILEMSRMEAGQLALRPSRFALRPLIESVSRCSAPRRRSGASYCGFRLRKACRMSCTRIPAGFDRC